MLEGQKREGSLCFSRKNSTATARNNFSTSEGK
jgi:hypothetical protein